MVEFIGMLKVTVKKGTNLAIRDMMSSDPYVVLNLGKQVSDLFVILFINTHLWTFVNLEMIVMFGLLFRNYKQLW